MEKLRESGQKVDWHNLVWGKSFVPRLAVILWLLCQKRLNSKDRLKRWGIKIEDGTCVLCQEEEESMDHLFFSCKFTGAVWRKIQQLCLVYRGGYKRSDELQWLSHHWKGSSFTKQTKRLALAVTMYKIWQSRNMKMQNGISKTEIRMVEEIVDEVSTVAATWKNIPLRKENWNIVREWRMSRDCFRK